MKQRVKVVPKAAGKVLELGIGGGLAAVIPDAGRGALIRAPCEAVR